MHQPLVAAFAMFIKPSVAVAQSKRREINKDVLPYLLEALESYPSNEILETEYHYQSAFSSVFCFDRCLTTCFCHNKEHSLKRLSISVECCEISCLRHYQKISRDLFINIVKTWISRLDSGDYI